MVFVTYINRNIGKKIICHQYLKQKRIKQQRQLFLNGLENYYYFCFLIEEVNEKG